ncbi:hypothetical protein L0665_05950 [Methanogenium marinum]|uniref:Uncharacterized protein n=1 Tax=Methanogenium marinum TaxID=348610 RepID=A0A9Q4KPY6_9EURY|nr:hypothetical protein [Methanogenium marinum]MDE4908150.1 hypothetical protein [Methanogenium marinum]
MPIAGSNKDWIDSHIDNNRIATYVSSSVPAAIMVFNADGTLYQSIPLSNDQMDLDSLEFSDGRIYYSEYDSSELSYSRTETVYEFDLSTEEQRTIYNTTGPQQRVTNIAADGDHVVLRGGVDDQDLILHTLSTGTNQIIFDSRDIIYGLAKDGDRIMWGCERTDGEPGREIHVYTVSTGEDDIIEESQSIRTLGYGDISGDRVVWIRTAEEPDTSLGYPSLTTAGGDIRLTNLSTGETFSIEIINALSSTYISEDIVVYVKKPEVDYDNPNTGTIRVYDIGTATFSDIASEVAGVTDFDNGLVIWHRYSPRSDWLTTLPGMVPNAVSPENTQNVEDIQGGVAQNNSPQNNPVNMVVLVLVLIGGIATISLLKKRK